MSDAKTPIYFRGTVIEMGEPPSNPDLVDDRDRTVNVTLQVSLSKARQMGPLLYTPAVFSAYPGEYQEPLMEIRTGSVVLVEANRFARVSECHVRRSSASGLYMIGTQDDVELTLELKKF